MGKTKRKRKKSRPGGKLRLRITPAAVAGMAISALIAAMGLYGALVQGSSGSLYFVVLGLVMAAIVAWRSVYRG